MQVSRHFGIVLKVVDFGSPQVDHCRSRSEVVQLIGLVDYPST